jgi:hypothetical protein
MRVTLADVDGPPVWRQVVIPAGYTLDRVHGVIQGAMGWQNSHLHMFRITGRDYGPAHPEIDLETLDEKQFRIGDLMKTGDLAGYEYDFGDGWEHELAVEASAAADAVTVPGVHRRRGRMPARGLRRSWRIRRAEGTARRAAEPRT